MSRLQFSGEESFTQRTICRNCEGQCQGKLAGVLDHLADLTVIDRVKHTGGAQNLGGEMSRKTLEGKLEFTMAKLSSSLRLRKMSGVADKMGLRQASPKPREVGDTPVVESDKGT